MNFLSRIVGSCFSWPSPDTSSASQQTPASTGESSVQQVDPSLHKSSWFKPWTWSFFSRSSSASNLNESTQVIDVTETKGDSRRSLRSQEASLGVRQHPTTVKLTEFFAGKKTTVSSDDEYNFGNEKTTIHPQQLDDIKKRLSQLDQDVIIVGTPEDKSPESESSGGWVLMSKIIGLSSSDRKEQEHEARVREAGIHEARAAIEKALSPGADEDEYLRPHALAAFDEIFIHPLLEGKKPKPLTVATFASFIDKTIAFRTKDDTLLKGFYTLCGGTRDQMIAWLNTLKDVPKVLIDKIMGNLEGVAAGAITAQIMSKLIPLVIAALL